jgi:hypothetical protein
MQESIVTLSPREKIITGTKRASTHLWSLMALMRAHYYNEAPLPETLRFWVKHAPERKAALKGTPGVIVDYGILGRLVDVSDVQLGDEWEVQIKQINLHSRVVEVKPIRLVQRDADLR